MRLHFYLLVLLGLLISCDKEPTWNDVPHVQRNPQLEIDPSLSPDSYSIYYVSVDKKTSARALCRMNAATADRQTLFSGNIGRSPTISPDNKQVSFIDSLGMVRIYNLVDKSVSDALSNEPFHSVLFLDESDLVCSRNDSLFIIDLEVSETKYFTRGSDPTYYGPGAFICIVGASRIVRFDELLPTGTTLKTVSGSGVVHYPSIDRQSQTISYTVLESTKFSVEVVEPTKSARHLQYSTKARALIVGPDLIILTGPDDRFYASNLAGTLYYPFIPEANSEGGG